MAVKCEECDGRGWRLITLAPGRICGLECIHCIGEGVVFKTADAWLADAKGKRP